MRLLGGLNSSSKLRMGQRLEFEVVQAQQQRVSGSVYES
jgi:hypothetical protein